MKIQITREELISPLQHIIGAVEKRQALPILANVLLVAKDHSLCMTTSDTEIELQSKVDLTNSDAGEITVSARKLLDICKALPNEADIVLELKDSKLQIRSGRSKFLLSTLPANEFPLSEDVQDASLIEISSSLLNDAIRKTSFSMANQDVRFYLNGLLLEVSSNTLRSVATDGHRLAYSTSEIESSLEEPIRVIIPRKSVLELGRLLNTETDIGLMVNSKHLKVVVDNTTLTTKLIDGRFPDYNRVIPLDCDKEIIFDKEQITQALYRASILSNEKYRGIRLKFTDNSLLISTNNPEQEEANDELEIDYNGDPIEVGFNVSYLLEAFNRIETENVCMLLKDGSSSCVITPFNASDSKYVVMPMRL